MINMFCEVHNVRYHGEMKEKRKMLLCSSYFPANLKTYV